MNFDRFVEATLAFARQNEALIEITLFCLGFAESLVITSFIVPASVLFLGIAALHAASGGEFLPILLAGTAGAFFGDIATYAIGRRYKDQVGRSWPFRSNPGLLPKASAFFDRWGIAGIAIGKFVGPMRPLIPLVCGLISMPWQTFGVASFASSLIWTIVFLAPSFYGVKWSLG